MGYDSVGAQAAPVSRMGLRFSPTSPMQGLLTAGELNSRHDAFFRPRKKVRDEKGNVTEESVADYDARIAAGRKMFPPTPTISAGARVQVSYDGSENFHPADVQKVTGNAISVELTLASGQKVQRVNVRHVSDPFAQTSDYQKLYTEAAPEGGVWKYADNETEIHAQIADLRKQLSLIQGVKPAEEVTDEKATPRAPSVPEKKATEKLDELMAKGK